MHADTSLRLDDGSLLPRSYATPDQSFIHPVHVPISSRDATTHARLLSLSTPKPALCEKLSLPWASLPLGLPPHVPLTLRPTPLALHFPHHAHPRNPPPNRLRHLPRL